MNWKALVPMRAGGRAQPRPAPGETMMNHSADVMRRPWRTGPPIAGIVAAVVAAAALALLLAACSGSPSSTGGSPHAGGPANSPSALAYSACMRSHRVPNYPDPDSSGQLPKTGAQLLGVSTSQYQAAQQACRHLLPTSGSPQDCMLSSDCPPALVQQMLAADRKLARCMRSHGVPNFPDPTNGGASGPVFNITAAGISDAASHTRQFEAKLDECARLVGGNAPESFG
jgi:hypothetical protein